MAGLLDLIDRVESLQRTSGPVKEPGLPPTAWLALRVLVQAIPPDRRLQVIDQVIMFADADLLRGGQLVEKLEQWRGDDANRFLTELTELAVQRSREVFASDPVKREQFRQHLECTDAADLLDTLS